MNNSNTTSKDKLSDQVQEILFNEGFLCLFNFPDFRIYKKQCKNDFNPAQRIAEKFIDESDIPGDYQDYIF